MDIEYIGNEVDPFAIVIRASARVEGIKFFSPESFPQQVGLMTRPAGYLVPRHVHNLVSRNISLTQEVLLIRMGTCHVKIYDNSFAILSEVTLNKGDVIFLAQGGHEIEMIDECQILEVKQGPYVGTNDKTII